MIEVKGISKSYGTTLAVDDVSFKVDCGEIVGFLGPNGAGKSTTMKVLTCFLAPSGGTAEINGHDILDDPVGARSQLGYLPESTPLYDEMGVLEYLHFMAGILGLPPGSRSAKVDELIDTCGIGRMAHKDIGELSKGFRQRVGLAQALLNDPPVLVLDEPTSGLDPGQIVEIRELIRRIAKNKAILLSTHILPEAQTTCDRILIINDGKIVGEGTSNELLEMAAGEERFTLTLSGRHEPDSVVQALASLGQVTAVEQMRDADEKRYKVTAERGADLREKIFDYAVQNSLKLLELNHDSTSLEDIFLKLTGGTEQNPDAGGDENE